MDKKFKKVWLTALRSGKYKQARGALRKKRGGFCCLGVACDLLKPQAWSYKNSQFYHADISAHNIPELPMKEVGISNEEAIKLAELNDSGKRFSTIAKYIEENL